MSEFKDIKSKINLKDIKSTYIIKTIFSFLHKKQKLKIIVYNKELQKNLLICFEDYKKISRIYKIGEKNGSTLGIDSSYENINKISNNKYISDGKLRDMTKEFIIQKCKLSKEELNHDYGNKR